MQLARTGLRNAKHAPSTCTLSGGGGGARVMLPPGARTQALALYIPGVVKGQGAGGVGGCW